MALFGRPTQRDEARAAAGRNWLRRRNPLAVASLVLGIFSLIEFGATLVFGLAGVALGVAALVQLRRVRRSSELPGPMPVGPIHASLYEADETPVPQTEGRRLAWVGIVLSALSLLVFVLLCIHPWKR